MPRREIRPTPARSYGVSFAAMDTEPQNRSKKVGPDRKPVHRCMAQRKRSATLSSKGHVDATAQSTVEVRAINTCSRTAVRGGDDMRIRQWKAKAPRTEKGNRQGGRHTGIFPSRLLPNARRI